MLITLFEQELRISRPKPKPQPPIIDDNGEDLDFLDALPEDIRKEVLASRVPTMQAELPPPRPQPILHCSFCSSQAINASVNCSDCHALICTSCDIKIHNTVQHQVRPIQNEAICSLCTTSLTEWMYCVECNAAFCNNCDNLVHFESADGHQRMGCDAHRRPQRQTIEEAVVLVPDSDTEQETHNLSVPSNGLPSLQGCNSKTTVRALIASWVTSQDEVQDLIACFN